MMLSVLKWGSKLDNAAVSNTEGSVGTSTVLNMMGVLAIISSSRLG